MCKMAHFGNCDPGTADQEYCIFHKPNKTEEEAREFWEKFLERFKPRVEEIEIDGRKVKRLVFEEPVDASGFVFPKNPKRVDWFITYTDTKTGNSWIGRFPFEHALFVKGAIFWNATFEGTTSFSGAVFKGVEVKLDRDNPLFSLFGAMTGKISAIFDKTKFLGGVSFENTCFEGSASFNDVYFLDGVTFENSVFEKESMFTNSRFEIQEIKDDIEFEGLLLGIALLRQLRVSANFNRTRFKRQVYFDNSLLMRALFIGAIFEKDSSFSYTNFKGMIMFTQANFIGKADFSGVEFHEDVTFSSKNVQFSEDLFLGMYMYERPTIQSATFYDEANFLEAKFYGNADFGKVKFKKGANFALCEFHKAVDFQNCEFLETKSTEKYPSPETTFAKAKFKGDTLFTFSIFGTAIFNFSVFEEGASFNNAVFKGEILFGEVEFKKAVEFKSAKFQGGAIFDGAVFERAAVFVEEKNTTNEPAPKFYDRLSFANCDFRQGVDFLGSLKKGNKIKVLWDFLMSRFSDINSLIEATRVQRLSFEHEGKRDEADRMFVLEMRAKRKARLKNSKTKFEKLKAYVHNFIEWLLGDLPSEYGTNWVRLFLFSLLIIVGNALLYTLWSNLIRGFSETSSYLVRFANALYYSLVTFTTLGYGDMHPTGWLKALSALEALTGAVFMALIVAVIARKWMR